ERSLLPCKRKLAPLPVRFGRRLLATASCRSLSLRGRWKQNRPFLIGLLVGYRGRIKLSSQERNALSASASKGATRKSSGRLVSSLVLGSTLGRLFSPHLRPPGLLGFRHLPPRSDRESPLGPWCSVHCPSTISPNQFLERGDSIVQSTKFLLSAAA